MFSNQAKCKWFQNSYNGTIHSFIHSFTSFSVYPYTYKVPRMWKLSK